MGRAIKVVLIYVGLPLLVLGILMGMVFQYNLNENREAHYKVTELCVGKKCGIYERFVKSGHEICGNLFDGKGVYLEGNCFGSEEIRACLGNSTYQECVQKHGGETSSIIERVNSIREQNKKYGEDKVQLSSDLSGSISALQELRRVFDSMYPDTFYCYGDGAVEYSYEIEEINKTNITVEGAELMDRYHIKECGFCNDGVLVEIRCRDAEYWRYRDEWEWRYCKPCDSEYREICENGVIEKEVTIKKPVNVTVMLQSGDYTKIDLKGLSHDNRVRVFEQIKGKDCYTTKQAFKEYKIEDDTITMRIVQQK